MTMMKMKILVWRHLLTKPSKKKWSKCNKEQAMPGKVTKNSQSNIQMRIARMTTKSVIKMIRKKERTFSTKRTCRTLSLKMLKMKEMRNSLILTKMTARLSTAAKTALKAKSCQQQKANLRTRKKVRRRSLVAHLLLMKSLRTYWMAILTRTKRRNIWTQWSLAISEHSNRERLTSKEEVGGVLEGASITRELADE